MALPIALGIVPFARTLTHDLVWDDHYVVSQVEDAYARDGVTGVWKAPFLSDPDVAAVYYRPIVNLSFLADARVADRAPWPFHVTNLLLHVVACLLVFGLVRRIFSDAVAGAAAAALFAVLPVHVESVAFVSARTDLWGAVFGFGSLLAWYAAGSAVSGFRRVAWLCGSVVLYAAGCLAKEVVVLLPILVMTWSFASSPRSAARPLDRARRAGLVALCMLPGLAAVLAFRAWAVGGTGAGEGWTPLALAEPGLAGRGFLWMCRLLAAPWPHNALYTRDQLDVTVTTAIVGLLAAGVHLTPFRYKGVRVAWLAAPCLLLFLLPVLAVPSDTTVVIAERYLYLPSVGLCILAGAAFSWGVARRPRETIAVGSAVVVAFAVVSFVRAGVWANDDVLTEDLVRKAPGAALAWDMRGQVRLKQQRYDEALAAFDRAVTLEPADAAYHNDAGIALRRLGRPDLAVIAFRRSLELNPDATGVRLNLAYACISLRDTACIEDQRQALARQDPSALQDLDSVLRGGQQRLGR
ncbi:MAG TPA: tetratricopeptide repeat protein [Candidatus Polarisedimenticolaceae bacterium]